jgi:hypothetical protein
MSPSQNPSQMNEDNNVKKVRCEISRTSQEQKKINELKQMGPSKKNIKDLYSTKS